MKKTRNELIKEMGLEKVKVLEKHLSKHDWQRTAAEKKEDEKAHDVWLEFTRLCSNLDNEDFADTMRGLDVENRQVLEEKICDCVN